MSRKTFDPDADVPLPPHGVPPATGDRLACAHCQTLTLRATLSQYGARCFGCYQAFCRTPQPYRRYTQAGGKPNAYELVQRLMDRKAAGEQLTKAQADFLATAGRRTHRMETAE
jgi:hypothetical protein